MKTHSITRAVGAFLVTAAVATGQALPEHHVREQPVGTGTSPSCYMSVGPSSHLRASVGFSNRDDTLTIRWIAGTPSGASVTKERTHPLPFHPLAATFDGGLSHTLYVVGWYERTGDVVVEEWTFDETTVGVNTTPAGGETVSFAVPRVDSKRELLREPGGAVYAAVFHPTARHLLLLQDLTDDGEYREIVEVDVDADAPYRDSVFTNSQIASLDTSQAMTLGVVEDTGAVYVFVFEADLQAYSNDYDGPATTTHVLGDVDADGVFEISFADDADEVAVFGAAFTWSELFEAAAPP